MAIYYAATRSYKQFAISNIIGGRMKEYTDKIFHFSFSSFQLVDFLKNIDISLSKEQAALLVVFLSILFLPFLIDFFLARSFLGLKYRFLVAPGVIIHELAHALMCLITFAPIEKITLFDKDGGSVAHKPSKIPVIGQVLISIAPIYIGLAVIFMISSYMKLPQTEMTNLTYDNFIHDFMKIGQRIIDTPTYLNIFLLYFMVSISIAMVPSKQDIKNSILSMLIIGAAVFAANYFLHFSIFSLLVDNASKLSFLASLSMLLILFLVLSIFLYGITLVFRRK